MGCGTSFVKYVLFFFNLLFALGGLALIGIGAAFLLHVSEVTKLMQGKFAVAPWLFIVVGIIVFVISFFGCCGAVRESHCMVVTYSVMLLVIIIVQVVLAVLVFVYVNDDNLDKVLNNTLRSAFDKARTENTAKEAYESLEIQMGCCGVQNAYDYGGLQLPNSCCASDQGALQRLAGGTCTPLSANPGCVQVLSEKVRNWGKPCAGIAIGVAVIEVLAAVFGLCLANSIRNMDRRYA